MKIKRNKKYSLNKNIFIFFIVPFVYSPLLFLQTLINHSLGFSIGLSILATCSTLTFEFNEWNIYFRTYRKQPLTSTHYFKPLLAVFVRFCISVSLMFLFIHFNLLSKSFLQQLPDTLTAFCIMFYFFSYGFRQYLIEQKKKNHK